MITVEKEGAQVDLNEFWTLIERSRDAPGDQETALIKLLVGRSSADLQAFHQHFDKQLSRAYRWDIWGAGFVLNGGMSDDSFDDFCRWLVGRGRDAFERVLADPDSLADVPGAEPDETNAEGLSWAAADAHEETYGTELPLGDDWRAWHGEPAGEAWDEDEVDGLYPRLAARAN